ncbi:MAG: hypothetical protein ACRC5N_12155, partial [Plesiomonas sp.]
LFTSIGFLSRWYCGSAYITALRVLQLYDGSAVSACAVWQSRHTPHHKTILFSVILITLFAIYA